MPSTRHTRSTLVRPAARGARRSALPCASQVFHRCFRVYPSFPVLRTDDDRALRNGLCAVLNKMQMDAFTACLEAALEECLEKHGDPDLPEVLKGAFRELVREYSLILLCKGHYIRAGTRLVKYGNLFKTATISGPCLCSPAPALLACVYMELRRAACVHPCCVASGVRLSPAPCAAHGRFPYVICASCASSRATRRWRGCTVGHARWSCGSASSRCSTCLRRGSKRPHAAVLALLQPLPRRAAPH